MKKQVLFLCTGNAARSQMAEALAREFHGESIEPVSAGSRPAGFVHPLAIRAMTDLGVDMDGARSKGVEEFTDRPFDAVVTVCDSAAEDCPFWPNAGRVLHWPIVDPSFGPDAPATRYHRFLATRDELRRRIDELARELAESDKESGSG
jgi:arsenate reductase (thioredoxin)